MPPSRDTAGESALWRSDSGLDKSANALSGLESNSNATAHEVSGQIWNEMRVTRTSKPEKSGGQQIPQGPPPPKDDQYKVIPKVHVVKAGEVLNRIARAHLGADASAEAVNKHMDDIVRINGLRSADHIRKDQSLKLPGETKDGGIAIKDAKGNLRIEWGNGAAVRENRADGSGFSRHVAADGSTALVHWGPRPGDNYKVEYKGTNVVLTDVAEQNNPVVPSSDSSVRATRARVVEHSRAYIMDSNGVSKLEFDMTRFEQRARTSGVPESEVRRTYDQIDRLFTEKTEKDLLTPEQRAILAQQVMSQAARPSSIDQGNFNTCSVNSVEVRTYSLYPATAAKVVADAAITGRFTSPDGTTVKVNPKPRAESKEHPPKDGNRSHASQLFQVVGVNLHYEKKNKSTNPPGHLRYEQFESGTYGSSNGEGVFDYADVVAKKSRIPSLVYSQPELYDDEIVGVSNAITGRNERGFLLAHTGEGRDNQNVVARFDSPQKMKEVLTDLNARHMMPASIRLHSANDPFYTDSDNGAAGGSGGWHQATILKYDPADPNFVEVDNSWGSKSDHRKTEKMSIDALYAATRAAGTSATVAVLEQAAEARRADKKYDLVADLDLARQKRLANLITEEDYVRQLDFWVQEYKQNNKGVVPQDDRTKRKVAQVTLPTFTGAQTGESLVRVLRVREQVGILNAKAYEDELYKVAIDLSKSKDDSLKKGVALAGAEAARFEGTLFVLNAVVSEFDADRRQKFIERVKKYAPVEIFDNPKPPALPPQPELPEPPPPPSKQAVPSKQAAPLYPAIRPGFPTPRPEFPVIRPL